MVMFMCSVCSCLKLEEPVYPCKGKVRDFPKGHCCWERCLPVTLPVSGKCRRLQPSLSGLSLSLWQEQPGSFLSLGFGRQQSACHVEEPQTSSGCGQTRTAGYSGLPGQLFSPLLAERPPPPVLCFQILVLVPLSVKQLLLLACACACINIVFLVHLHATVPCLFFVHAAMYMICPRAGKEITCPQHLLLCNCQLCFQPG